MPYFNKGPWKLCDSGIDVNCEAGIVAVCDDPNTNQHFNACLIASAPDMYGVLKECVRWIEMQTEQREIPSYVIGPRLLEYKKLLLKAEGREV